MSNASTIELDVESKPTTFDISDIRPADIIVTRNDHTQSKVIQVGSCSSYSHALLAVGNGMGIEAVGDGGMKKGRLTDLLYNSSYAALYRHKSIDANFAGWICEFAEEQQKAGKPYDYLGASRAGVVTGCNGSIAHTKLGVFVQLADAVKKRSQAGHDESFFCSELVVRAYEKAGLPLINFPAHAATPGMVVKSNYLSFIKDIKTTA
ncbi:MAG: hypothetical protein ACRBCI_14325 [Cellvibrionaceae bacterium]